MSRYVVSLRIGKRLRRSVGLAALMVGVAAAPSTGAQSKPAADAGAYPARPVRVVVPYAPGGSSDAVARILKKILIKELQQWGQVVKAAGIRAE